MKKRFYRFLHKRITHPRKYDYYFYRWIIEKFAVNKDEMNKILVYLTAWMVIKEHESLHQYLSDIFVFDGRIYIYTRRPGLWIGKAGCIIDDLIHSINYNDGEKIYDYHIELIEDLSSYPTQVYNKLLFYSENY